MMQRSLVAILLSLTGIIILWRINMSIADVYDMSGEKTRAVFNLIELSFFYKYFAGVFGFLAIILSIMANQKGEKKQWVTMAMVFSVVAFLATFIKIWKVMV
jgi:crotonobetainyl-CoA:carnitine CoA-transferase CaiB-like acyl-CoA transferase